MRNGLTDKVYKYKYYTIQVHGLLGFEGTKTVLDYPPYHLQKQQNVGHITNYT